MTPHGAHLMRPYFDDPALEPLSAEETARLRERFRPEAVRYALAVSGEDRLADPGLDRTADAAHRRAGPDDHVVTVIDGA